MTGPAEIALHGGVVALDERGLLILGRPGAGKSALALELMALGAILVADDRVVVAREGDALVARAPATLAGLIEARGFGLLRAPFAASAPLVLAIDLDAPAPERMPGARALQLLGRALPLLSAPRPLRTAALAATLRYGPPLDPERHAAPGEGS